MLIKTWKAAAVLFILFFVPLQAPAQTEDMIALGDSAYKKFDHQTALNYYMKALAEDPRNFEALWRISRAYIDLGDKQPKEKQLDFYEKAKLYADSAVAVNPDHPEGYVRRAIATGKISLFKGVWKSIGLVKKVRDDCEKALKLDPNHDLAYYVFARAHQKVAEKPKLFRRPLGLAWASRKKARKLYEKAIALRPNFIMYHLDYAKLLIEMDEYEKAKAELRKIETLPLEDEDDPKFKEEAKKLLAELESK